MTARERELTDQLEQCQRALAESRRENEFLRQKIDLLVRRVFGSSSEQLDPAQLELLLQLPPATPPEVVAPVPEPAAVRPRKERTPPGCPRICRWSRR